MTKYYITLDGTEISGRYTTRIPTRVIPDNAIEISEELYTDSLEHTHYDNSSVFTPERTLSDQELRNVFKRNREQEVSKFTLDYHTNDDTWVFDADKNSIMYMGTVLSSLSDGETNLWVLNDNRVVYPTKEQLTEIHRGMVNKVNSIWVQ